MAEYAPHPPNPYHSHACRIRPSCTGEAMGEMVWVNGRRFGPSPRPYGTIIVGVMQSANKFAMQNGRFTDCITRCV